MTIRRNLNLAAINDDFMDFEKACDLAPDGVLQQAKDIRAFIGEQADQLLSHAQRSGIKTCNCDGIREIEVLIFDMIRRKNPDSQIERAVGIGGDLREADCATMDGLLAELERNPDTIGTLFA